MPLFPVDIALRKSRIGSAVVVGVDLVDVVDVVAFIGENNY